jgi:hypothetical protein
VVHDAGGGLGCLVWSRALRSLPQLMIQAPHGPYTVAGMRGSLVLLLAVPGGGWEWCMMQAAALVFGMEPGGAVTAPAYDLGTSLTL